MVISASERFRGSMTSKTELKTGDRFASIDDSGRAGSVPFPVPENHCRLIRQRELASHTKFIRRRFERCPARRSDIILVGEMCDLETISLAITAAETGHLMFATLHTNSAIKTMDRVIDSLSLPAPVASPRVPRRPERGSSRRELLRTLQRPAACWSSRRSGS